MTDGRQPPDPDDLGDLGRELRGRVGEEWRRDAEEGEQLAALARRRGRTLTDVAREHAERGVGIRATVAGQALVGEVVHAAGDLLTLVTAAGRVHLRTDGVALTTDSSRVVAPGPGREDGVDRWRTRMFELEMAAAPVRVWLADGREIGGIILAVGADHLLVRGPVGEEHAIAEQAVAWVLEEHRPLR